jgi:hypothetical protein
MENAVGGDDRQVDISNGNVQITRSPTKVNHGHRVTTFSHQGQTQVMDAIDASNKNGIAFKDD